MNTFGHVCTHCGAVDKIPRAITFFCPACKARPGEPCVDPRTVATTRRPVSYLHNARQDLLHEADKTRPTAAPVIGVGTADKISFTG